MSTVWAAASVVESLGIAGAGCANAAYFARRAWGARGPRRAAAGVLALLCAGSVLAAVIPAGADAASVLGRAPLLTANVATLLLVWAGVRR